MRQFCLLLCVFSFMFSCKNSQTNQNSLKGKWTWTKTSGGFSGRTIVPKGDNDYTLIFENSENYKIKYKNGETKKGKYFITEDESLVKQKKVKIIKFDDAFGKKCTFVLTDSSLILVEDAYDGRAHSFVKAK